MKILSGWQRRVSRSLALSFAFWLTLHSPLATAEIADIQLASASEKVLAKTQLSPLEGPISLFGMRNETLSFQLALSADTAGATGVQLVFTGLEDVKNSSGVGGSPVRLFRVDSVDVKKRSEDLFWKPGSSAEPAGFLGSVPDRLVPLASAQTLSSQQRLLIWVDVWVPPNTPPGLHIGSIEVTCDGCTPQVIPVELELLAAVMPDTVTAKTMLWFSGGEREDKYVYTRYFSDPAKGSETAKRKLRLQHYQLARRHRITLFWDYHQLPSEELDSLLSGQAFSPAAGYWGPGQGLGQDLLVIRTGEGSIDAATAQAWQRYAEGFASLVDTIFYTVDEPESEQFAEVNRRALAAKPLDSFVTTAYTPKLRADVFAAPAQQYLRKDARRAHRRDARMWIYNGARPYSGSFAIDDVAISTRVNPWIQYNDRIERWFYWDSTYYLDFQGGRGAIDVGKEAQNFSNRHGDHLNGDGLLFYPGRDFLFPASDVGVDGPLPSIRLKNWRRGIEDVEYLVMARAAGYSLQVDALLAALLPQTLDSVSASSAVSWPEEGRRWDLARRYLFELLRDGTSAIALADIARPPPPPKEDRRMGWWPLLLGAMLAMVAAVALQKRG